MSNTMFLRRSGASAVALACALLLSTPALAEHPPEAVQAADAAAPDATASGFEAWGITDAELQADPSVVYGVLDNGMRFALKRNAQPEGEASIRFLFDVGTRDEADGEEGAAHFVEHMAFNGSTNIPEGELVPRLERLGLAFGADTNAETYPHYTMYKLDLPKLDDETVGASFEILREMASELTITPAAVEAEKGIIVSEYQVRNSPLSRRAEQFQREIMQEPRIADRAVAEPDAIRSLTAETLRGFYEGYYRPEKATLVVVGDFDLDDMKARITDTFADWEGKGAARDNFEPRVAEFGDLTVSAYSDPNIIEVAEMYRVADYAPKPNTLQAFQGQLLDGIASIALSNRLSSLTRAEDAPILNGAPVVQDIGTAAQLYGMVGIPKEGQWRGAVETVEREWRRMAEFGVTNSELAQAKAALESSFATAAAQSNSASSAGIASALALTSLDNSVRQSPEQQLQLYTAIAATLTPEAVQANFLAKWGKGPNYAMVATKTELEGGKAVVASALAESAQVAVAAPEEAAKAQFAYTDFGAPGRVVSDTSIDDLGIRTIAFENGVRLNLMKTGFEAGKIVVQARVGTGLSTVENKPGLEVLALVINGGDDLGQNTSEELTQVLAGKQVAYGYSIEPDAISMTSATTPDDLLLQLQVMAAQVTDTAFSAQSQRRWESGVSLIAGNLLSNPQTVHGIAFESILANGDSRLGFVDPAVMAQRSIDDLKAVVGGQFANGPIEIGMVGDIDEDAAIAAVAQTLGAIERPEVQPREVAPVNFTQSRDVRYLYHRGQADQGMISLSWPTTDSTDDRSLLTRRLLAELIQLEALKVLREELGATYTPSTQSNASSTYAGFGYISLVAPAEPGTMDEVSKVIHEMVASFAQTAPSDDAMQRARQPVLESFRRGDGNNSSWIGPVAEAQSYPQGLDYRRNRSEILASITPEEVLAMAKEYLTGEPIEIRAVPTPPAPPAQ